MDASFIEGIQHMAVLSADPSRKHFQVPAEPKNVYYTIDSKGDPSRHVAAPLPRANVAGDIGTVVEYGVEESDTGAQVEYWYSRSQVQAVAMRAGGEAVTDTITFHTPQSAQLKTLKEWGGKASGVDLTQAELRRFLRTTFLFALDAHPELITIINTVDVMKRVQSDSKFTEKGTSMDKGMVAESSIVSKLPPLLHFDVPVYESPLLGVRAKVRAAFEFDPNKERFVVEILPGEIEAATVAGEQYVLNQLTILLGDSTSPIYYGICSRPI